jgi:hypothetical protein
MSTVDFQHITTSMVGEVAVVEILAKELRFPPGPGGSHRRGHHQAGQGRLAL